MGMHAATIRAKLEQLIERRLHDKGCDSLLDFSRKYATPDNYHPELFDEPLCPMVNRLCPDDLCYLPAGHVGTTEGYHITGTVAYTWAEKWHYGVKDMAEVGTSRSDLINLGYRLQEASERRV